MTRQIRHLGIGLMVCFAILFVQLNRLTVFDADELNDNPNNTREILRDFSQPRGTITTADGVVIARVGAVRRPLRAPARVPRGPAVRASHRLLLLHARQRRRGEDLQRRAGRPHPRPVAPGPRRPVRRQGPGRQPRPSPSAPTSSGSPPSSSATARASVVALDPRTGAILALVSYPTYDPNLLADHDTDAAADGAAAARRRPGEAPPRPQPTRTASSRARRSRSSPPPPALSPATVTVDEPVYPVEHRLHAARHQPARSGNFGGESCGGTCSRSCGCRATPRSPRWAWTPAPTAMIDAAEAFGFNQRRARSTSPTPARSIFPDRLRPQPAGAGPVGHRPERRVGHPAADGAGRRRRWPTAARS